MCAEQGDGAFAQGRGCGHRAVRSGAAPVGELLGDFGEVGGERCGGASHERSPVGRDAGGETVNQIGPSNLRALAVSSRPFTKCSATRGAALPGSPTMECGFWPALGGSCRKSESHQPRREPLRRPRTTSTSGRNSDGTSDTLVALAPSPESRTTYESTSTPKEILRAVREAAIVNAESLSRRMEPIVLSGTGTSDYVPSTLPTHWNRRWFRALGAEGYRRASGRCWVTPGPRQKPECELRWQSCRRPNRFA